MISSLAQVDSLSATPGILMHIFGSCPRFQDGLVLTDGMGLGINYGPVAQDFFLSCCAVRIWIPLVSLLLDIYKYRDLYSNIGNNLEKQVTNKLTNMETEHILSVQLAITEH